MASAEISKADKAAMEAAAETPLHKATALLLNPKPNMASLRPMPPRYQRPPTTTPASTGSSTQSLAPPEKTTPSTQRSPRPDSPAKAALKEVRNPKYTISVRDYHIMIGYYADPDTECQAFHVCTANGQGGLTTYSFLCPNGTIFNQGYFICDWWFNFDCSEAEGLYNLNDQVAAEREAASQPQAAASDAQPSYASQEPLSGYGAEGGQRQARRRFNN